MEKNHIMTKAAVLLSVVAMATMLSSCGKEAVEADGSALNGNGDALSFTANVAALPLISEENPDTKATLINRDGTGPMALSTSSEFYVAGWDVKEESGVETLTPAITAFEKVKYVAGSTDHVKMWITVDGSDQIIEHRWKSGEEKLFYAYSGVSPESASVEGASTNAPVMKVDCSLSAQTDVLMGYGKSDGKTGSKMTGTASVLFHHPLAAVEFELGTIKAPADSFKITGITMEGLYAEGTAEMDKTGAITWSDCTGKGSVSQTVTSMPTSGKIGEVFLAIPQTFTSDSSRVVVSATMGKKPINLHILLKGKTLTAGAVTKYSINYDAHRGIQLWENGPYWAPANVGADYPEEPGWYFSWGNEECCEPNNLVKYDDARYKCDWIPYGSSTPLEYGFDIQFYYPSTSGGALNVNIDDAHDAATKIMGKGWRMPTKAEFDALVANTTQKQIKRGNQNGYLFTGKDAYARRSIFLPSTGYGSAQYYSYGNVMGSYWSRTIAAGTGMNVKAYRLQWNKSGGGNDPTVDTDGRAIGMNIRAVENF